MIAGTSINTNTVDHRETGQFMAFLDSGEAYVWTKNQTNGSVKAKRRSKPSTRIPLEFPWSFSSRHLYYLWHKAIGRSKTNT
jgi:hypothetical protein